jgi:hypothetical protein
MIWLLAIFRSLALWMKRSGLITGDTDHDRRVFLQTFAALGGAALLRNVPVPDQSMPVVNLKMFTWFRNPPEEKVFLKQEELDDLLADEQMSSVVSLTFDGLFERDVQ